MHPGGRVACKYISVCIQGGGGRVYRAACRLYVYACNAARVRGAAAVCIQGGGAGGLLASAQRNLLILLVFWAKRYCAGRPTGVRGLCRAATSLEAAENFENIAIYRFSYIWKTAYIQRAKKPVILVTYRLLCYLCM